MGHPLINHTRNQFFKCVSGWNSIQNTCKEPNIWCNCVFLCTLSDINVPPWLRIKFQNRTICWIDSQVWCFFYLVAGFHYYLSATSVNAQTMNLEKIKNGQTKNKLKLLKAKLYTQHKAETKKWS